MYNKVFHVLSLYVDVVLINNSIRRINIIPIITVVELKMGGRDLPNTTQ